MRGKDSLSGSYVLVGGITPAYAGKSLLVLTFLLFLLGSPPPMRGKENDKNAKANTTRITPAYAGKSCPQNAGMV